MPGRGLALKMSADHPKGRMDEVFLKERVKKKRGRERETKEEKQDRRGTVTAQTQRTQGSQEVR